MSKSIFDVETSIAASLKKIKEESIPAQISSRFYIHKFKRSVHKLLEDYAVNVDEDNRDMFIAYIEDKDFGIKFQIKDDMTEYNAVKEASTEFIIRYKNYNNTIRVDKVNQI